VISKRFLDKNTAVFGSSVDRDVVRAYDDDDDVVDLWDTTGLPCGGGEVRDTYVLVTAIRPYRPHGSLRIPVALQKYTNIYSSGKNLEDNRKFGCPPSAGMKIIFAPVLFYTASLSVAPRKRGKHILWPWYLPTPGDISARIKSCNLPTEMSAPLHRALLPILHDVWPRINALFYSATLKLYCFYANDRYGQ